MGISPVSSLNSPPLFALLLRSARTVLRSSEPILGSSAIAERERPRPGRVSLQVAVAWRAPHRGRGRHEGTQGRSRRDGDRRESTARARARVQRMRAKKGAAAAASARRPRRSRTWWRTRWRRRQARHGDAAERRERCCTALVNSQAGRGGEREWRGRELMNDAPVPSAPVLAPPRSMPRSSNSRTVDSRSWLVGSRAWDRGTGRREAEGHSHLLSAVRLRAIPHVLGISGAAPAEMATKSSEPRRSARPTDRTGVPGGRSGKLEANDKSGQPPVAPPLQL